MRRYCFKPTLLPTVVALILFPMLLGLGFWQLHRAEEKRQLLATYQASTRQPAQPLVNVLPKAAELNYLPVEVAGIFANEKQLLLDTKYYQHRLGYQVVTPVQIADSHKAILVNRGWIPRGETRRSVPEIAPVAGTQTIKGYLVKPATNPLIFSSIIEKLSPSVWRIQQIDFDQLSQQLGLDLYPYVVLLASDQSFGFERDWKPVTINPERHVGYAVQWFGLAVVLVITYIAVNLKRKEK